MGGSDIRCWINKISCRAQKKSRSTPSPRVKMLPKCWHSPTTFIFWLKIMPFPCARVEAASDSRLCRSFSLSPRFKCKCLNIGPTIFFEFLLARDTVRIVEKSEFNKSGMILWRLKEPKYCGSFLTESLRHYLEAKVSKHFFLYTYKISWKHSIFNVL